jgi:Mg2+/Co2+ transporter CorB
MMSINRYRLRYLVKQNNKKAIRVNQMLLQPDKLLSIILIGNTLANIISSTIATLIGQHFYGEMGVAIATISLTLIILVFSEMTPKTLAALHPQQIAFACSIPLKFLQNILAPLVHITSFMAKGILQLFGVSVSRIQKENLTSDELRSVVSEAGGLLPIEHKSMIISLLDIERATVEDIMVPKAEIVGIDLNQPWSQLLEQLETTQHTRLPLYRSSIDNLVGMIHLRDVLNLALEKQLDMEHLIAIADPPYFIPEATPLNVQIVNFKKMKRRSCFVVDEYGDIHGLVAMEDILEEIVGDFTTDIADLSRDIMPQEDGWLIVDASVTLRQLSRLTGWQLPTIGPRTLSGLVIEYLGYIPPADCCLTIERFRIEILKVGDNTIKSIKMKRMLVKKGL